MEYQMGQMGGVTFKKRTPGKLGSTGSQNTFQASNANHATDRVICLKRS